MIVRDLQSVAVIHVGNGKGVSALDRLSKKLRKKKWKIVAMDMFNAYVCWVEKHFPNARFVFDLFHVINLMNERLDKLQRRYVTDLDAWQRSQFKKFRMVFLRNMEDQDADNLLILSNMRKHFQEFGDAYLLKVSLLCEKSDCSRRPRIWRRLSAERGLEKHLCNRIQCTWIKTAFRRWATLPLQRKQGADRHGKDDQREITRNH